jgi:regulator of protease activity HflC (stomatin/prohibitin superfamily)
MRYADVEQEYKDPTWKYVGWSIFGIWLGIAILTSVVIVGAGERGVVTQFGKVTGRTLQPGFNIKAPWPIQGAWVESVQVQKEQVEASAASTDLQQVSSVLAVNYHLDGTKLTDIYINLSADYKNRIIDPAIQETFKAVTAKFTAAELLNKRAEVKVAADIMLKDRLDKYGIIVDDLSIVNFDFSTEFNKAIEQKQVSQQGAEQAQYNLQRAQLDAQAQQSQKTSLSPELIQKYFLDKWNGQLPTYMGTNNLMGIPINK